MLASQCPKRPWLQWRGPRGILTRLPLAQRYKDPATLQGAALDCQPGVDSAAIEWRAGGATTGGGCIPLGITPTTILDPGAQAIRLDSPSVAALSIEEPGDSGAQDIGLGWQAGKRLRVLLDAPIFAAWE